MVSKTAAIEQQISREDNPSFNYCYLFNPNPNPVPPKIQVDLHKTETKVLLFFVLNPSLFHCYSAVVSAVYAPETIHRDGMPQDVPSPVPRVATCSSTTCHKSLVTAS